MAKVLRSETKGTWAYDTMSRRVVEDMLDTVVLPEITNDELQTLRKEILNNEPLRLLEDGPDMERWNELLKRDPGTWLSAPWLLSEFYLYRRIASATGYFTTGFDVFRKSKQRGLETSLETLENLAGRIDVKDPLVNFLFISLWGNRMDLSLWPDDNVASSKNQFDAVLQNGQNQLLADDTENVLEYVDSFKDAVVDIVVDNAGFELCSDLFLADKLLSRGGVTTVRLRTKHHPTFVSDVLQSDVQDHINFLRKNEGKISSFATRWAEYLDTGRLVCLADDGYWAMPYPFWEMPSELRNDLAQTSDLVILKGDANYRRALGDRSWPFTAPFSDVCSYFPTKVLCLRTLKAELGCGMDYLKIQQAQARDPNWLTNGQFGVIQFV